MLKKISVNILSLFSGSLVGQLIHVLVLPLLSAWFTQGQIGAFFSFSGGGAHGLHFCYLSKRTGHCCRK